MNTLILLGRKALTNIQTPILSFRYFCSQASSSSAPSSSPSAPNNKLFVAGSCLFLNPVPQLQHPQLQHPHDSNGIYIEFDLVCSCGFQGCLGRWTRDHWKMLFLRLGRLLKVIVNAVLKHFDVWVVVYVFDEMSSLFQTSIHHVYFWVETFASLTFIIPRIFF